MLSSSSTSSSLAALRRSRRESVDSDISAASTSGTFTSQDHHQQLHIFSKSHVNRLLLLDTNEKTQSKKPSWNSSTRSSSSSSSSVKKSKTRYSDQMTSTIRSSSPSMSMTPSTAQIKSPVIHTSSSSSSLSSKKHGTDQQRRCGRNGGGGGDRFSTTSTGHQSKARVSSISSTISSRSSSSKSLKDLAAGGLDSSAPSASSSPTPGSHGKRSHQSSVVTRQQQPSSSTATDSIGSGGGNIAGSFSSLSTTATTASSSAGVLAKEYEVLLTSRNKSQKDYHEAIRKIRNKILVSGIPDSNMEFSNKKCSLRGKVWKVLLNIQKVSASDYIKLVEKGPCDLFEKIKNDTFRTLATDKDFTSKVDEYKLIRILNSFVWRFKQRPASRLVNLKYSYVQGMNVLAAPILYVMPELDSFYTFASFIQHTCPLYVQPALEGVHCGLTLMDSVLKVVDPVLFQFLESKRLTATVYAFPSVMTFSACTQPLSEVLKLWDFFVAYGFHMNIFAVIAQLILMREDLLISSSPMKLLRTFPDLNSKAILNITRSLITQIDDELYDNLVRHTFDPMVFEVMCNSSELDE